MAAARLAAALILATSLISCATPAERANRVAASAGFESRVVAGKPFHHRVFIKHDGSATDGIHVYLEGDGTPWITRRRVAADPTPRQPLMLELMRLDPQRAVYLGRPCYFGITEGCRPELWTSERYSREVVASLTAALERLRSELGWPGPVTLIGHSGGGALAMLMAPRVPDTVAVLTLAANLDSDAWTRLHGYTPLAGSLNPAAQDPLPAGVRQLHVVGGEDRNVPPEITRAGAARQRGAEIVTYPQYGHQCCWEEDWRSILDRLDRQP